MNHFKIVNFGQLDRQALQIKNFIGFHLLLTSLEYLIVVKFVLNKSETHTTGRYKILRLQLLRKANFLVC